mmetsp:Transcript_9212/g.15135  ORF Transcript_9212/g.15135 Transcript_9212/m.15135 type:complete len:325 (-) Transcript_9212:106-1080(-)
MMFLLNKTASIFFSIVVAAVTADEMVASTPSLTNRELKADIELMSNGSPDGSITMSYETSAKSTKTKSAKTSSSKTGKAKATKSHSYSMSYGPGCKRSDCVDPEVPRFIIDGSTDIGDTLLHDEKPGTTKRCGCDCYTLEDGGDDPDFDPELGDTQHFAYRKVTSTNFSIKSRTCGVKCYGEEGQLTYGRVGLEVRQSLDPLAANIFISHKPHAQAEWSWRKEYNGTYFSGSDGSPDVKCLWITLTRNGNIFKSTYAYDPQMPNEECESDFDIGLDQLVEIDMSETVYVGLAVSSEVYSGAGSSCVFTKADFESIEFVCDGDGC